MEKQLELKEAATRRRLLALKQQLQNEATATASSTITSTTSPQSHKPHPPELKPTSPRITETMQVHIVHGNYSYEHLIKYLYIAFAKIIINLSFC